MTTILNAALWLLPILILIPFLIVFCVLGAKRGPARALISVGATLLSTAAAYFLAKLLSRAAASRIGPFLGSAADIGKVLSVDPGFFSAESLTGVLESVASALMKPVFFVPVLLITALIVKVTVSVLCRKMEKPESGGQRFAGVLISACDAVLLLLLLNLPLYGTLNLIGRVSEPVLRYAEAENTVPEDAVRFADLIRKNGMVRLYGSPVCEKAFDLLTSFRYDGRMNSLGRFAKDGSTAAVRFSGLNADSSPDEIAAALAEGKLLVEKHPFVSDYALDLLASVPDDPEMPYLKPFRSFAEETKNSGNRQENVGALLSAVMRVIGTGNEMNDFRAIAENDALIDGIVSDINSTKELSTLKNDLIALFLEQTLGENMPEAMKNLTDGFRPLTGDEIEKEARSFRLILSAAASASEGKEKIGADAAADLIEGLARHPLIGPEKTVDVITDLIRSQGGTMEIISGSSAMDGVREALTDTVTSGIEGGFRSYLDSVSNAAEAMSAVGDGEADSEAMEKLLGSDPVVLRTLKKSVTPDLLTAVGVPEELSAKLGGLFEVLFDEMAAASERGADTGKEAEAITDVMSVLVNADAAGAKTLTDVIPAPERLFDRVLGSGVLTATLNRLVRDENGTFVSDPLGCFGTMSGEAKNELKERLEKYGIDKPGASEGIKELKYFFGIA